MSSSPANKALQGAIDVAKYNKDWSFLVEMALALEKKNEIDKAHVSSVLGALVEEEAPISHLRRLIDQSDLVDASEKAGSEDDDSIFVTALKANADAEIIELLLGTIHDRDFDVLKPFDVDPFPHVSLATLKVLLSHHSVAKGRTELLKMVQYIENDDELVDKIILLMRVFVTGSVDPNDEIDKCCLHYFLLLEFSHEGCVLRLTNFTAILEGIIKKYPECCRHYLKEFLPVHILSIFTGGSMSRRIEALKLLIEEYPASAFVASWPERDMAPTHYLIQHGEFSPQIDKILETVPMDRPCPTNGLFPAQHAATRGGSQEDFLLECIYKLLRKDPMVVSSGTTGAGAALLDDPDYLELCRKDRELSRIHYAHHVRVTEIERKRKRQDEAIETERKRQVAAVETERKLFRARVESKQT